jgi:hypothetical protein
MLALTPGFSPCQSDGVTQVDVVSAVGDRPAIVLKHLWHGRIGPPECRHANRPSDRKHTTSAHGYVKHKGELVKQPAERQSGTAWGGRDRRDTQSN